MKFDTYHMGMIPSERQVIDIINAFMLDDTTELLSLHVDLEDDEYQQIVEPIVKEINRNRRLDCSLLDDLCLDVNGFKLKYGKVNDRTFFHLFRGGMFRSNNARDVINKVNKIVRS